jgi:hypothetical protein
LINWGDGEVQVKVDVGVGTVHSGSVHRKVEMCADKEADGEVVRVKGYVERVLSKLFANVSARKFACSVRSRKSLRNLRFLPIFSVKR